MLAERGERDPPVLAAIEAVPPPRDDLLMPLVCQVAGRPLDELVAGSTAGRVVAGHHQLQPLVVVSIVLDRQLFERQRQPLGRLGAGRDCAHRSLGALDELHERGWCDREAQALVERVEIPVHHVGLACVGVNRAGRDHLAADELQVDAVEAVLGQVALDAAGALRDAHVYVPATAAGADGRKPGKVVADLRLQPIERVVSLVEIAGVHVDHEIIGP